MNKIFFCVLAIFVSIITISADASEKTVNTNNLHQENTQSSKEDRPKTADKKGACIYTTGPTQVCEDDVTEKWCKAQPNYQWSSNTECP